MWAPHCVSTSIIEVPWKLHDGTGRVYWGIFSSYSEYSQKPDRELRHFELQLVREASLQNRFIGLFSASKTLKLEESDYEPGIQGDSRVPTQ